MTSRARRSARTGWTATARPATAQRVQRKGPMTPTVASKVRSRDSFPFNLPQRFQAQHGDVCGSAVGALMSWIVFVRQWKQRKDHLKLYEQHLQNATTCRACEAVADACRCAGAAGRRSRRPSFPRANSPPATACTATAAPAKAPPPAGPVGDPRHPPRFAHLL